MTSRLSTSTTNNAVNRRNSRYTQGGLTDRYPNRLGFWDRRELKKSDTDFTVTLQPDEDRRPDIVAYRVYGKAELQWLVLQYNTIVDIETEFTAGTEIRLPDPRRVNLDILTQPIGGNRIE